MKCISNKLLVTTIILCLSYATGCIGTGEDIIYLTISGSTTVLPLAQNVADAYMDMDEKSEIQINGGGSSVGIRSVGEGTANIGMASRELKESEKKKYPRLIQHIVAIDGIALIVHPSNQVSSLTVAQIREIYKGKYRNWNELGGKNQEIVPIGRDSASGTREFFWKHVMKKQESYKNMLEMNSNGAIKQQVSQTPGAIGYIGLGYIDETIKPLGIKIKGKTIQPTIKNVVNEKYPIARSLNMFTDGRAEGLVKNYLDFIKSPDGQKIVEDEGFVPITKK